MIEPSQSPNRVLRACRENMKLNAFGKIIADTDNIDLFTKQPQILFHRIQAAIQLRSHAVIDELAKKIPEYGIKPSYKMAAIKLLALHHHPEHAARSLIDAPSLHDQPQFINLAKLVLRELRDKQLRKELAHLLSKVTRGGTLVSPKATTYHFADQPKERYSGSVEIELAATTPRHHFDGLLSEVDYFRRFSVNGRQPKVLEYENVFTDPVGQIWTENGEVIVSRGVPLPSVAREDTARLSVGFAANRGSRGIYHWIVDYLPGFSWIHDSGLVGDESFKILLNAEKPRFEHEMLDILGFSSHVHKISRPVFVERLLVSRVGFKGILGWSHLDNIFGELGRRSAVFARESALELPKRVYITRRGADRRVLTNETDIENEAGKRGFRIYDFAQIPILHQIAIARHAKTIMAPHGAGLSHIVFSDPGTQIVELLPIQDGTYPLRFNYARISMMKGHRYHAWVEEQRATFNEWSVDVPAFTQFLDRTLAS